MEFRQIKHEEILITFISLLIFFVVNAINNAFSLENIIKNFGRFFGAVFRDLRCIIVLCKSGRSNKIFLKSPKLATRTLI